MDVRRAIFSSIVMMLACAVLGILPTLVSATCPSNQSPFAPGCSTCTECCIFQFGLGSCGASVLWDGIVRDPGCNSIWAREQALGFPGIQG
ncbi:hypothetical protein LTR40_006438, partial [Exophiala xenobiotica]